MNKIFRFPGISILITVILISSCKESLPLPVVETTNVSNITSSTAESGGNVTDDGGAEVYSKGICWNTTGKPDTENGDCAYDGSGTGIFTSFMEGLISGTTYYVRAYAKNINGTAYGNDVSFKTKTTGGIIFNPNLTYGTVSDIDGNTYKTIQIGTQTWMAENLRTTKLNEVGTSIPLVTNASVWNSSTTSGYCWYNNDINYKNTYGALYNWYAVNTAKLCPTGWHPPSYDEWITLLSYHDGAGTAGGKLKETGIVHWTSSQYTQATNETGFTALPGSNRGHDGQFSCCIGYTCYFWSATAIGETDAWGFNLDYNSNYVQEGLFSKHLGFSVRCVKD